MNYGIDCDSGTQLVSFNGNSAGSFSGVSDCNCNPSSSVVSLTLSDISAFNPGGDNSVSIASSTCEGLSEFTTGGGIYATVTVTY